MTDLVIDYATLNTEMSEFLSKHDNVAASQRLAVIYPQMFFVLVYQRPWWLSAFGSHQRFSLPTWLWFAFERLSFYWLSTPFSIKNLFWCNTHQEIIHNTSRCDDCHTWNKNYIKNKLVNKIYKHYCCDAIQIYTYITKIAHYTLCNIYN